MQNIIEKYTEKITCKNKNQKCSMCFSKRDKSIIRKHKCCNTFTCVDCFEKWYNPYLVVTHKECFVCRKYFYIGSIFSSDIVFEIEVKQPITEPSFPSLDNLQSLLNEPLPILVIYNSQQNCHFLF